MLLTALDGDPEFRWQPAECLLERFDARDFAPDAADRVLKRAVSAHPDRDEIRLVGIADLRDRADSLLPLLVDEDEFVDRPGQWFNQVGWSARLARARLLGGSDLERVLELSSRANDAGRMIDGLAYTLRPSALELVAAYLEDRSSSRRSGDQRFASNAQFAIHSLATWVPGFPIEMRSVGGYSDADVRAARRWMADSQNWADLPQGCPW